MDRSKIFFFLNIAIAVVSVVLALVSGLHQDWSTVIILGILFVLALNGLRPKHRRPPAQ